MQNPVPRPLPATVVPEHPVSKAPVQNPVPPPLPAVPEHPVSKAPVQNPVPPPLPAVPEHPVSKAPVQNPVPPPLPAVPEHPVSKAPVQNPVPPPLPAVPEHPVSETPVQNPVMAPPLPANFVPEHAVPKAPVQNPVVPEHPVPKAPVAPPVSATCVPPLPATHTPDPVPTAPVQTSMALPPQHPVQKAVDTFPATLPAHDGLKTPDHMIRRGSTTLDLPTPTSAGSCTPGEPTGGGYAASQIFEMSQKEVTALVQEALLSEPLPSPAVQPLPLPEPPARQLSLLTHAASFAESNSGKAAIFRVGCWDKTYGPPICKDILI